MRRLVVALLLVLPALLPSMAEAAYPGANGRIAYVSGNAIWTVNPDGSAPQQVTSPTAPDVDRGPRWSPDGTRIVFYRGDPTVAADEDLYLVNPDGTGETLLMINGREPTWSPDGTEIAFLAGTDDTVYRVNADGTNRRVESYADFVTGPAWSPAQPSIAFGYINARYYCDPYEPTDCGWFENESLGIRPLGSPSRYYYVHLGSGTEPSWSPTGQEIVHRTARVCTGYYTCSGTDGDIGVVSSDGSGQHTIVAGPSFDMYPAWSPDGTKVVFWRSGGTAPGLWVVNADGSNPTRILDHGLQADWQPLQRPYVRPVSAGPVKVSLVQAFTECSAPNRNHGPPLAHPSCGPPTPASPHLATSSGETRLKSVGVVKVKTVVGVPGGADDSDVRLRLNITNVMNASDFSDYTGLLHPELTVRLTDRDGFQRQTTQDFPFGFDVPCAATASTTEGATCDLATTADTLVPGSVPEGTRAIWQLGQVRVYDGGPAGDGQDASLFAVQGVFVP